MKLWQALLLAWCTFWMGVALGLGTAGVACAQETPAGGAVLLAPSVGEKPEPTTAETVGVNVRDARARSCGLGKRVNRRGAPRPLTSASPALLHARQAREREAPCLSKTARVAEVRSRSALGLPADSMRMASRADTRCVSTAIGKNRKRAKRSASRTESSKSIRTHDARTVLASFYGAAFAGKPMAGGGRFDPSKFTCASRTLPFGSRIQVCRAARCVVVTTTDRGPYVPGRELDLSEAAARALGMIRAGVARVTMEKL